MIARILTRWALKHERRLFGPLGVHPTYAQTQDTRVAGARWRVLLAVRGALGYELDGWQDSPTCVPCARRHVAVDSRPREPRHMDRVGW
jgi:hypothetical protein